MRIDEGLVMMLLPHSDIPHSIRGGDNDAEMCLIVKNGDKARIKAALAADPVPGLAKIMDIKKVKKNFSRFDDKRTLAGAYDLFLADDRILPYLPEALGSKFFIKKKQPISVRVSRKDVSHGIRAIYHRTQMIVSTGACTNVKVAHLAMSVDEMVENILVATNNCAAHIPKGWNGIQSISIKTNESVALPVYNALAALAKLPPMSKKQALTKRKLEEDGDEEAAAPKAAKKAKKEAAPVKKEAKKEAPAKKEAKKEVPAKKETKKEAKKEAAPAKKAAAEKKAPTTKKVKAAKKETPVKETSTTEKPSKKRKGEDTDKTVESPAAVSKKAAKAPKAEAAAPKQTKSTPPKTKKTPPAKKK